MVTATQSDCPHCHTKQAGFTYLADRMIPNTEDSTAAFSCNVCGEFICIPFVCGYQNMWVHQMTGDFDAALKSQRKRRRGDTYPVAERSDIPDHLSQSVRRAFEQAQENARRRMYDAAASMYRKAMDLATRELDPALSDVNLAPRIDRLAATGRITEDLREWAHVIRLDGNRGAHDDDELSRSDIEQLGSFTELFLTYVVSMPTAVKLRKAEATQG